MIRGFRDGLRSYVPKWLSPRNGFQTAWTILYTLVATLDVGVQTLLEAVMAPWPGVGPPDALPLIGASRGIRRGEADTDASYATRLQGWRDTWDGIGSDEILVGQIQAYLGNNPMVRMVNRAGFWTSIDSAGNITHVSGVGLFWDDISNPERNDPDAPWWGDIWIIVYPTEWPKRAIPADGHPWNDADIGLGHAVPRVANDAIRAIVDQWRAPHTWLQAIIWSYNAALFDPTNLNVALGNPDGRWGNWHKPDGSGGFVPARNSTDCRFWIPPNG